MRERLNRTWLIFTLCGLNVGLVSIGRAEVAARSAGGPAGNPIIDLIADEGFNRSAVPDSAEYLTDQIGGRLTNSPAMRRAERWASQQFKGWGLQNVRAEGFAFGRGWWIESAHIRMVAPRPLELKGIPVAWTPPTEGALSASIVVAPMASLKDFASWHGKLSGKIVLVSWPAPEKDETGPVFERYSDLDITKFDEFRQPVTDSDIRNKRIERFRFTSQLDDFLSREGALALVTMSRTEGRLVHGEGSGYRVGHTPKLPAVELAAEDYRKLTRLAKVGD